MLPVALPALVLLLPIVQQVVVELITQTVASTLPVKLDVIMLVIHAHAQQLPVVLIAPLVKQTVRNVLVMQLNAQRDVTLMEVANVSLQIV